MPNFVFLCHACFFSRAFITIIKRICTFLLIYTTSKFMNSQHSPAKPVIKQDLNYCMSHQSISQCRTWTRRSSVIQCQIATIIFLFVIMMNFQITDSFFFFSFLVRQFVIQVHTCNVFQEYQGPANLCLVLHNNL